MRNVAPMLIALVLLGAGAMGFMALRDAALDRRLDGSVIGLGGLSVWLKDGDIAVRKSHPRLSPTLGDLGLRVLPLYDVDLADNADAPETPREVIGQATQRDIRAGVYWAKLDDLPSLVLLPKWTSGMMLTKVAHDETLIPPGLFPALFRQMRLDGLRLDRRGAAFVTDRLGAGDDYEVALFQAQTFAPDSVPAACREHTSFGDGVLILACNWRGTSHETLIVSDPDLMNNHGLSLAQNAGFSRALILELTAGDARPVYVDTSPEVLISSDEGQAERRDYTRSSSDLARFFDYPFSVLWSMLMLVLALLLWRGAKRFGPVLSDDDGRIEQSKTAAIAAKARLLRLSGNDGQMVADFVRGQVQDLTTRTFGPNLGAAGQKRYFDHLARRDPGLASAFHASVDALITNGPNMPRAELHRALETYKHLLERVVDTHGPARISETR